MTTPEQRARLRIDELLAAAGWSVQDVKQADLHAAHNGTSVYTGVETFPMLPDRLSKGISSLLPGHDHRAIVIEYTVLPDGDVREEAIYRAIVSNKAKLIYEALLKDGPMHSVALRSAVSMTDNAAKARFNRGLDDLQADLQVEQREDRAAQGGLTGQEHVIDQAIDLFRDIPGMEGGAVNRALDLCRTLHPVAGHKIHINILYGCIDVRVLRVFFMKCSGKGTGNRAGERKALHLKFLPRKGRIEEHEDIQIPVPVHPGMTGNGAHNHSLRFSAFGYRFEKATGQPADMIAFLTGRADGCEHLFLEGKALPGFVPAAATVEREATTGGRNGPLVRTGTAFGATAEGERFRVEFAIVDRKQERIVARFVGPADAVAFNLILSVIPDGQLCLRENLRALKPDGRAVIFDKFAPEAVQPSVFRRFLNLFSTLFGTDITRRFGEILQGSGAQVAKQEASILRGMYQVILLKKSHQEDRDIQEYRPDIQRYPAVETEWAKHKFRYSLE